MEEVSNYILNIPTLKEGCTLSLSNPNFQNDTITYKYVKDSSETMPMFLLFQRQHDTHQSCENSGSHRMSGNSTIKEPERTTLTNETEFPKKTTSLHSSLLLTTNASPERDVVISNESSRRCSDDNGFYSATEDSVSDIIDTNVNKEDLYSAHGRQWRPWQESVVNTGLNRQGPSSSDSMALDVSENQDADSQSTKALLNPSPGSPARPNFKLSCYRPNGTTLSLEDEHLKDVHLKDVQHWYVVVSRLTMKEKLTKRQLFQIACMTFLGFIFVGLIIIWVFSPALF